MKTIKIENLICLRKFSSIPTDEGLETGSEFVVSSLEVNVEVVVVSSLVLFAITSSVGVVSEGIIVL
jgi:hypothetical protein